MDACLASKPHLLVFLLRELVLEHLLELLDLAVRVHLELEQHLEVLLEGLLLLLHDLLPLLVVAHALLVESLLPSFEDLGVLLEQRSVLRVPVLTLAVKVRRSFWYRWTSIDIL